MRVNNLSARLKVNGWLKRTGREPLPSELSYEEFASELRKSPLQKPLNFHLPPAPTLSRTSGISRPASKNRLGEIIRGGD